MLGAGEGDGEGEGEGDGPCATDKRVIRLLGLSELSLMDNGDVEATEEVEEGLSIE